MTKNLLYIIGAVFIVIGLLGFVSDPILGIFETNTLHNIVHLASGILALVFAGKSAADARRFALILGVVYGLVTVLGFLSGDSGSILGLIEINGNDNILHIALTVVLLAIGLRKSDAPVTTNM
jgi:hypothetical protein